MTRSHPPAADIAAIIAKRRARAVEEDKARPAALADAEKTRRQIAARVVEEDRRRRAALADAYAALGEPEA